jgi:hypothetical protein
MPKSRLAIIHNHGLIDEAFNNVVDFSKLAEHQERARATHRKSDASGIEKEMGPPVIISSLRKLPSLFPSPSVVLTIAAFLCYKQTSAS